MPMLIGVFAGRTCHCVGFVMRRLIYYQLQYHIHIEYEYLAFLGTKG